MFTLLHHLCAGNISRKEDHDQQQKIQNVHQKRNFVDNKQDDTDKNDDIDVIFNEVCFIFAHFHICFLCFSSFTTIYHTLYFEEENCASKF